MWKEGEWKRRTMMPRGTDSRHCNGQRENWNEHGTRLNDFLFFFNTFNNLIVDRPILCESTLGFHWRFLFLIFLPCVNQMNSTFTQVHQSDYGRRTIGKRPGQENESWSVEQEEEAHLTRNVTWDQYLDMKETIFLSHGWLVQELLKSYTKIGSLSTHFCTNFGSWRASSTPEGVGGRSR